jgi:hypothetical protein
MKFVYQNTSRSAVESAKYHVALIKHEAWYGEGLTHGNTFSFRLAGLDIMLAISTSLSGETNCHYDGNCQDSALFHRAKTTKKVQVINNVDHHE